MKIAESKVIFRVVMTHHRDESFGNLLPLFPIEAQEKSNYIIVAALRAATMIYSLLVHIATPSRPILTGFYNINLVLAPFNTNYRDMETDMNRSGIIEEPNLWKLPYVTDQKEPSWSLMSTHDFFYFVIPFEIR